MPSIDERVVKLSLDDSQFDKASDKTIKKLDELKASLNFDGAVESFKEIDKAAKQTDFSPMEKGVEAVSIQFNALATIADTALRRVINSGIDSVERTLKSLTIDNVTAGWDKYADKTSAVQTIMAATASQFDDTGVQMEYVEGQLEKLNWFTDETSYAFLDMVNNIGKFTSNGIALDKAATAMQGISNWAAISGSGIQGASMAMYNLSQAIGLGALTLQDWKSVELANMGTVEFKQMAMEVAVARGELVKLGNDTYRTLKGTTVTVQTFRDSLSEKWLSSDVLIDVLGKYGEFTNTLYELSEITDLSATPLIRYINEYKDGTLDMAEAMTATGLAADELVDWLERLGSEEMDLGRRAFAAAQEAKTFEEALSATKEAVGTGWMQTFEYLFGNYQEAKQLWSDLAEGLYEVFVESGNMRNGVLRDWKALGGRTYLIEGLYTLFGNLRDAVFYFQEVLADIFPPKTAEELVSMTQGFAELMGALTPSENTVNSITNIITLILTAFKKLGQVALVVVAGLEPIWELIFQIGSAILGLAGDIAAVLGFNLNEIFSEDALTSLYRIIYAISSIISALVRGALIEVISIMGNIIKFGEDIWATFKAGEGGITGFIEAIIINFQRLFDSLSGGEGIGGFIKNVIFSIQDLFESIRSGDSIISHLINGVLTSIEDLFESIRSGNSIFSLFFTGVYKIAQAALGGIALLISGIFNSFTDENIDSNPVFKFFKGIGEAVSDSGLIENIQVAGAAILQFISDLIFGANNLSEAGKNIHDGIGWILSEFKVLWDWFVEELTKLSIRDVADVALIVVIVDLIRAFKNLTIASQKAVSSFGGVLTSVSRWIDTLSGNGLNSVTKSINDFVGKTKYLQMAVAIGVLVDGLSELSKIDTQKLGTSVAAIAAVVGMLAGLMALMKKFSKDESGDDSGEGRIKIPGLNSMLQFAIGLRLLISAVNQIANLINDDSIGLGRYESIIAGLVGLGLVMAEVGAFTYIINKLNLDADLTKTAATLALFAISLTAMVVPVTVFSLLDWGSLSKGLNAVAISMLSFAASAKLMGGVNVKSVLAAAVAIDLIVVGIVALSVPIFILSQLDLSGLAKGIGAVTVMLVGLTAACVAISKWGSGNAAGMVAAGAAMLTFSTSVIVLCGAMHLVKDIPWDGIAKGVTVIVIAFAGFAGLAIICQSAAIGLTALAGVIISVGASFALFAVGVKTLVDAAAEFIVICGVIMAAGTALGDDFPAAIEKAVVNVEIVLRAFLNMLPNLSQEFIKTAALLISSLAMGIVSAAPDILNGLLVILTIILETIAKFGAPIVHALADLIDGMRKELPYLLSAAALFVEEFFAGLGQIIYGAIVGLGRMVLGIFGIEGISSQAMKEGKEAGGYMAAGLENGLLENQDIVYDAGQALMNASTQGMKDAADINSPSGLTELFGNFLGEGLVNGIAEMLPSVENSGFATMGSYFNGMTTGIREGGSRVEGMMNSILKMVGVKADAIAEAAAFSYEIGNADLAGLKPQERLAIAKEAAKAGKETGVTAGKSFNDALNTSFDSVLSSELGSSGSTGGGKSGSKSSGSKASKAAEKVKTAAEEIIESYKAALEELEYLDKKHKGEYNLFEALNPDITELEKNTNKLEYVNKQIETQLRRTEIAEEKYRKIAKAMGETSEEARNAEIEWIEAQVTLAGLQNERIETQNNIIENASKQLEIQQKNAELTYKLWQSTNQNASKLEQEEKKLEYTLAKLEYASNNVEEATKAYNEALEKYGEDATETKELMNELIQAQIDYAEIAEEVNEVQDAIVSLGVQQAELALENQSLAYDIWVQTHKNASQAEKEAKKTEEIMLRYEAKMQDLADATEAWKVACEEFGEESLEATEAYNAMLKAEKETLEGLDELRESEKAHLEYLTEELAIYAEQADLEDQLWETVNTAATNEERYLHDRDTLIRKQLVAEQEKLLLEQEYNKLLEEEGKDSQNTRKAYAEILKKQIEIAGYVQDQKDLEASLVQTAKEELSIASKRADLEDQLWETMNETATKEEKLARKTATLTRNKATAEKELVLLVKEYNRLLEQEGKESQNTLNAYNAILEKQIEIAGYLKEQKDLAAEALQNELDELEFEEKRLDVANRLWQATNSHASESLKYSHEVEQNTAKMVLSMKELNKLSEQYNAQIKRYGQNSEEARSAWEAYAQKQIEIIELQNERKELELEIIQNELDMISLAESRAKTEYEIWEALNEDLSDSAKKTKQISYQMQTLEYATEKLRTASKKYNYALKMYGEESKETQQLYNDMLSAQLEYVKTHNELKNLQAEILEKNNDILEQLQYSEKLLDYGYNMWEKLNDDISDAQKIEAQIKKLNQDLLLQVQRANYYGAEWKKAVAQYGSASAEAQEAYLNYLEALYKALDTQSSIADKETELTDLRTENAQKLQDAWDEVKAKDLVGGTSIYDELVEMGLSEAEIEQYVKEKAGIIEDTIGTEMDFSIENMQSKAEDALREWGLTWIDGTYEVADTVVTTAGDTMGEMSSIIAEGAAEGEAAAQQAMDEIESIVEEGSEEVVDTIEEAGDDTVNAIEEALQELIDAIANDTGQAVEAMDNLCNEIYTTATTDHTNDFVEIGTYMTLCIQQGITHDKWNVIDTSIEIMEEAIWWAKEQDFTDIGTYMTMGIQQGIMSGKWYVIDSIIQVVQEAIWWANQTAQIHSPSRVTMWMGEMLDAGFVVGIEKRAGEIARSMASAVQNGINAANKVLHTSNTVEFAGDLIAGGITGAIEGYSYNILSVGQAVLNTLADEYDDMVEDIIADNQWLIDALRDYGFDETTHGIEFVVNLDADEAKTTLENLFAMREENLEYYDDLLDMQERNAAKDQTDWAVKAEAQAIARELNRVMKSIESYEEQIEDIVKAGRSSSFEDSIAGKKLEYVQNIYSTKPLSALDIYRNTNSQLLRFTTWR